MTQRPSYRQMLQAMRLLADVASLKTDPPAQRQLLVDGLNKLIGTNQGTFYVGEDWTRGKDARFSHQTISTDRDPLFLKYLMELGPTLPMTADAFVDYSLGEKAQAVVLSFKDVLPDRDAERRYREFSDIRRAGRISEGAASFLRLPGNRMVGVALHQFGGERAPTPRQRALLGFAVHELGRLVREGHVSLPPVAPAQLPPRLRQMQDKLLQGQTPKSIARDLGLSLWTVRESIQRLYRYHGVNGREELAAKFIKA